MVFFYQFPIYSAILWCSKIQYAQEWGFLSVWIGDKRSKWIVLQVLDLLSPITKGDYTFTLMFPYPEFKKLMISGRRSSTYKTIYFGGI